jgi:hypothetical protein
MVSIKKAGISGLAGAAAIAALTVSSMGAASASAPYFVTVGGSTTPAGAVTATGTNTTNISFMSNFGVPMSCTSSTINGSVNRGAVIDGTGTSSLGAISALTFSNCDATSLHFKVTVSQNPGSWNIVSFPSVPTFTSTTQAFPIEIRNISATVTGTACNFSATGSVRGTFTPGTTPSAAGTITITGASPTFPLTIAVPGGGTTSTCGGQIVNGDQAFMNGSFGLSASGAIAHTI